MKEEQYRELYNLIKNAFVEMQGLVASSKEHNKYIFSHHNYPRLRETKDNGMPWISEYYGIDGPRDYSSLFRSANDDEHYYYYKKIPEFQKILDFFKDNISDLMQHPYFGDIKQSDSPSTFFFAYDLLSAFDTYMHRINSTEFQEETFQSVINDLFNRFFLENLPVSICVPILLIRFENDVEIVSDDILIRKLTDRELLSMYKVGGYSDTYELFLVSCATHILELQNYSLKNFPIHSFAAWDYVDAYPVNIIDKWFAAFRIITHYRTGYGQILIFPDGWGIRDGNLIDIQGVKIQKYPRYFVSSRKDIQPTPIIKESELQAVNNLFHFLVDNTANSLNIAINRLNMAYLRESDEDSIIDLMIGIEALVTKDDYGEITYKVSSRTAFLLSALPQYPYSITETSEAMKSLYKFRSKVVHGETIPDKLRTIKLGTNTTLSSIELARSILEYLILAMMEHPSFVDARNIDPYFLSHYETMLRKPNDENS